MPLISVNKSSPSDGHTTKRMVEVEDLKRIWFGHFPHEVGRAGSYGPYHLRNGAIATCKWYWVAACIGGGLVAPLGVD
jgi:hypothetical protein